MILLRRSAVTVDEKRRISKCIQKVTRRQLRSWHTTQAKAVLTEFEKLDGLDGIHKTPFLRTNLHTPPDPDVFATALREVYASNLPKLQVDYNLIRCIPCFTYPELLLGLRRMRNGRSMDSTGIVVEMVKVASDMFKQKLLDMFNQLLFTGVIDDMWHTTLFSMLPKSGNLDDPSNWRPIAILPILHKICFSLVVPSTKSVLASRTI